MHTEAESHIGILLYVNTQNWVLPAEVIYTVYTKATTKMVYFFFSLHF